MYLVLMIRLIVIELNLTMCSLLLKHNSYLLITWRGKGWLSLAVWARFGGTLVVIVDEVVIFACFEPTEDKALVVASFSHTWTTLMQPQVSNASWFKFPKTEHASWELKHPLAMVSTKLQECSPQTRSFPTLQASIDVNLKDRKWWGMMAMDGAKGSLECGKRENGSGKAEKHLEVPEFLERKKWDLGFGVDEFGEWGRKMGICGR